MFLLFGIPFFMLVTGCVAVFRWAAKDRSFMPPVRQVFMMKMRRAFARAVKLASLAIPAAGVAGVANAAIAQAPVAGPKASPAVEHKFSIADAIHLVVFQDYRWSVTLKVYKDEGIVKRALRCTDGDLVDQVSQVYEKTVFEMEPLMLSGLTPEAMMRQSEKDGLRELANVLLGLEAQPESNEVGEFFTVPDEASVGAAVSSEPVAAITNELVPVTNEAATPAQAVAGGSTFRMRGTVVNAANVPAFAGNGQVFQVTLKADTGGRVEPFCGVDLAAQCSKLGIKPGDRVAIGVRPNPRAEERGQPKKLFEVERI